MKVKPKAMEGRINMIDSMWEWLEGCPLVPQKGRFAISALPGTGIDFLSIDGQQDTVIKQYVNGDMLLEATCRFESADTFDKETLANIANCGFFRDLSAWIDERNDQQILPEMKQGCIADSVALVLPEKTEKAEDETACYVMELKLQYVQMKGI